MDPKHVSIKKHPIFFPAWHPFPLSFLSPAGDAHTAAAATWLHHDLVPVIAVESDGCHCSTAGEPAEDSEATVPGAGVHRGWEAFSKTNVMVQQS